MKRGIYIFYDKKSEHCCNPKHEVIDFQSRDLATVALFQFTWLGAIYGTVNTEFLMETYIFGGGIV